MIKCFIFYLSGVHVGLEAAIALANLLKISIQIFCGSNLIEQNIQPQDCALMTGFKASTTVVLSYLYSGHYDAVINEADHVNPIYNQFDTLRTRNIMEDRLLAQQLESGDQNILKAKRNLNFR